MILVFILTTHPVSLTILQIVNSNWIQLAKVVLLDFTYKIIMKFVVQILNFGVMRIKLVIWLSMKSLIVLSIMELSVLLVMLENMYKIRVRLVVMKECTGTGLILFVRPLVELLISASSMMGRFALCVMQVIIFKTLIRNVVRMGNIGMILIQLAKV